MKKLNDYAGENDPKVAEQQLEDALTIVEREGFRVQKPSPPVNPLERFDLSKTKGDRIKIAVISDTHFGSKYQQVTHMRKFLQYAKKQRVSAILHCGDVTDGPFKRHRNPHEVWLHTWPALVDYAVEALPELGIPWYFISGNHDDWFLDDGGADVVAAICDRRDDFTYMGTPQAFVRFGTITVEMFHPNRGGAYALSYNLQKDIADMPPGEKPHIYLVGNHHKACHLPAYGNVEGFLLPAYQSRTHWMKGKRLVSVMGGIILEFGVTRKGLADSLRIEWLLERDEADNDWPGPK